MDETALAIQARDGAGSAADQAFDQLVDRLQVPLFRFLLVLVGDAQRADELTQDAFVRAWERLNCYDSRFRFSTWLFTIARRTAANEHRQRSRRGETIEQDALPHLEGPRSLDPALSSASRDEAHNLWERAARVLTKEQRAALWLRVVEERSDEEIARILKRREGAVRALVHRARQAIRTGLEEKDHSQPRRAKMRTTR